MVMSTKDMKQKRDRLDMLIRFNDRMDKRWVRHQRNMDLVRQGRLSEVE